MGVGANTPCGTRSCRPRYSMSAVGRAWSSEDTSSCQRRNCSTRSAETRGTYCGIAPPYAVRACGMPGDDIDSNPAVGGSLDGAGVSG